MTKTDTYKGLVIFGSSGLGREIFDLAWDVGYRDFAFLDLSIQDEGYRGFPVLLDDAETVKRYHDQGWHFAIGSGEPGLREKIYKKYPHCPYPNLVHSSATLGCGMEEHLEESRGVLITAGCRLTNSITLGAHVLVNLNSTIGHDSILNDYSSLMPAVNISGNVELGRAAYIGTSASVINGANDKFLTIGQNSIIGAGAVVTRDIPENVVAVGIPAKPIKQL